MVLGGHKHHRLLLGLHHVSQQVEQESRLVVQAEMEEVQLDRRRRKQKETKALSHDDQRETNTGPGASNVSLKQVIVHVVLKSMS